MRRQDKMTFKKLKRDIIKSNSIQEDINIYYVDECICDTIERYSSEVYLAQFTDDNLGRQFRNLCISIVDGNKEVALRELDILDAMNTELSEIL